MVSPNHSNCTGRKTEKREEHLKTGITARAFVCLLAVLSAAWHFSPGGLGSSSLIVPTTRENYASGASKWIIPCHEMQWVGFVT